MPAERRSAHVRFFVAITPPEEMSAELAKLMGDLGDPWPVPHVTVKAPPGLTADGWWLDHVRAVASRTAPFEVLIGGLRTFGHRVVYLAVSATPLEEVHRRLIELIPETSAERQGREEPQTYVPHLTLAVARSSRPLPPLEEVRARLGPLPPFFAHELVVYRREDPSRGYEPWHRLAFRAGKMQ